MSEMMLTQGEFSVKVRNLSVLAIVSVVLIHAHAIVTPQTASPWMCTLCDFLFHKLTCWAVPFFFLMSGYWFGHKRLDYLTFLRKKVKTLAVPYLLFLLISTVVLVPVWYLQSRQNGVSLSQYLPPFWDVLGFSTLLPPGNGPLWYVRSLLILFALAPLWWLIANRFSWGLLLLGSLGLISPPCVIDGVIPFRIGQASYFFLGMWLSKREILSFVASGRQVCLMLFVTGASLVWTMRQEGLVVCGVLPYLLLATVWLGYDRLVRTQKAFPLSGSVFWIYATHILFLNYLLPPLRFLSCGISVWMFVETLLAATLTILMSQGCAKLARRYCPSSYRVLCGGR